MSLTRVLVNAIKKLIINVKKNRARKNWVKKIERAYQHIDPGANPIPLNIEAHIEKWQQLSPKVNPLWYKTYSYLSGKEDIDYVPEDIYYLLIEPKLNRHDVTPAYRDKNMYDKYNDKHPGIFPHVILRNIGGVYCDHDYNYIGDVAVFLAAITGEKLVVKPSIDTGSGKNVRFFTRKDDAYYCNDGEKLTLEYLTRSYGNNYLVQKYIRQHEYFNAFNKSSLNSIRVTTYRSVKTEEVTVLHANLRMGGEGSTVDNVNAGGAAVHIHPDGQVSDFASDKYGKKTYTPPSNPELKFSDMGPVPQFEQMKQIAKEIAKNYFYFRMLGFDFCLRDNGQVQLIEINFGGLGTVFQVDSGSLYGDLTDEVIEYCKNKGKGKGSD